MDLKRSLGPLIVALMVGLSSPAHSAAGDISTYAGGGNADSGVATSVRLRTPRGLAFDSVGNLYIADVDNHRVRKVSPQGVLTTVAGNGVLGFGGDGGPGPQASLYYPWGVAVDGNDDLYIADGHNHRIRKVDASTGIITTIAGTPPPAGVEVGYLGLGDGGPATQAFLAQPMDLAFDAQANLLIADAGAQRIRKIDMQTGIITTVAGIGLPGYNGDGIPAIAAALHGPMGIATAPDGSFYIADRSNNRIRRVDAAGIITTVAGTMLLGENSDGGPATQASLTTPFDVVVAASGALYIAESLTSRIRRVDAAGIITTIAGGGPGFGGDGGPAVAARLAGPQDLAMNAAGWLYVADTANNRVRRIEAPIP